jgi:hypothetical protein
VRPTPTIGSRPVVDGPHWLACGVLVRVRPVARP